MFAYLRRYGADIGADIDGERKMETDESEDRSCMNVETVSSNARMDDDPVARGDARPGPERQAGARHQERPRVHSQTLEVRTSRHVTSRHVTRARVCVCTGTALSVCTRVAPMLTRMRGGGGVSRLAHFYLFFTFFFEICLFTTLPLSLRALTSNTSKTFHSPPANRNAAQSVES